MLIEYVANRSRRKVSDGIGRVLIRRGLARGVYETRELVAEPLPSTPEVEISPVTGKPKRKYKRRDMQADQ